jgi:hypothetical protein
MIWHYKHTCTCLLITYLYSQFIANSNDKTSLTDYKIFMEVPEHGVCPYTVTYLKVSNSKCSWDSSTSEVRAGWLVMGWMTVFQFQRQTRVFLCTTCEAHTDSHPVGMWDYFSKSRAARQWNWPLTFIKCQSWECMELHRNTLWYGS